MVEKPLATSVNTADDAVGLPENHWYIAIVGNRSEVKCSKSLTDLGYESFVATQNVRVVTKNGRRKTLNRIVFPALVFVRTTDKERKRNLVYLPFIKRFMTDPSRRPQPKAPAPVAVVPDKEMDILKFMLENSDKPVTVETGVFNKGDRVRVVSGGLEGLEGIVHSVSEGCERLYVSLDILGCANVEIDRQQLQLI